MAGSGRGSRFSLLLLPLLISFSMLPCISISYKPGDIFQMKTEWHDMIGRNCPIFAVNREWNIKSTKCMIGHLCNSLLQYCPPFDAVSCAISSTSARDLWIRLQEQFDVLSKTTIFQMKSNLQTIKKGTDSITQLEARDFLAVAGVTFADADIVILALNGLPSEFNTFRCVIRGRDLREFRSQLTDLNQNNVVGSGKFKKGSSVSGRERRRRLCHRERNASARTTIGVVKYDKEIEENPGT
ncbi:hypothetical protein DVH24_004910 [Malus domestica]|uniref:Uncharacterized protein n=1 Tax=Malus domestica TaxID=3750 RepID=A0A498IBZ3_MALDO|nr:hypothetical protein DVH24_004910 [Malus domestica]